MHTRTFFSLSLTALLLCGALSASAQAPGTITTVAGTGALGYNGDNISATSASLAAPTGVATDAAGNLYIADWGNHRVRKVSAATGKISTIAGTGVKGYNGDNIPATSAQLDAPRNLFVDPQGNVYISDAADERIRKISAASGMISTIAGTGASGYNGDGMARFSCATGGIPAGLAMDPAGNLIFIDLDNNRIRKVDASGTITTIAGTGVAGYNGDGAATATKINGPFTLAIDSTGNIYFSDSAGTTGFGKPTTNGQAVTVLRAPALPDITAMASPWPPS